MNTPYGPAPPLVTGTFGSADFIYSVLGEGIEYVLSSLDADTLLTPNLAA